MQTIEIKGGILNVTKGVVVHQVNCMNRIGAGISGYFCKKYPIVEEKYHEICTQLGSKGVFGTVQEIPVTNDLIVVNMFSQYGYGNPKKTGKQYTNYDAFVNGLTTICNRHPNDTVYISEFIGCGFGGGDWNTLCSLIEHLPVIIVKQPDYISKSYKACK